MNKKLYIKPQIEKIVLDHTISLQMQSGPKDPDPRGGGSKGTDTPFQSPFGDKPFG
ncbi:MAG: hypothetical protein NT144_03145 [Bacteroidia bacterium]|nr:hypothetical protein [Bacteroidia bacterium]